MIALEIVGVRAEPHSHCPMIVLKESDGSRYLAIWIGATESSAILDALAGSAPTTPKTHDLMAEMLSRFGHRVSHGAICSYDEGVFTAYIVIDDLTLDIRPSDLVALSIRSCFPIVCCSEVMDKAGVELLDEKDDEVEKFKEFLDQICPEDFDT